MNMKKILATLMVLTLSILTVASAANADPFDQVIQRWTKTRNYVEKEMLGTLDVKATYSSAEYIEALMQQEAKKNLWTQQELDDYKYNFLGALRLNEMIPIMIYFNNNAESMHLGPFDIHVKLRIGDNVYKPVDYDKRFNFKLQGEREGLVFFPRFDKKTGKDLLKGVKSVVLEMDSAISPATEGIDTRFMWDVANDDPAKLYQGKTASKFETDRLLKRLDKLKKDKTGLESQLKAVNDEIGTIQKRLDGLAKK